MGKSNGSLRLCDVVLRVAGVIVPRGRREEWRREWRAELWHEAARLNGKDGARGKAAVPGPHLVGRALGALPDALAMRRFHPVPAQEDLWSALSVVLRSPGAAGAGILLVATAAAVDTVAVSVSRFVVFIPAEYRPFLLGLTAVLVLLLALAACVAAAVAVGWSDAARREEALRRAIGVPDSRLRRQRALEGVVIALAGCAAGAWVSSSLLNRFQVTLAARGLDAAATLLHTGPGVAPVALALAVTMAGMLGAASAIRRKRVVLD